MGEWLLDRQLAASATVNHGKNLYMQWQSSLTTIYAQINYPVSAISRDLEVSVISYTLLTGLC